MNIEIHNKHVRINKTVPKTIESLKSNEDPLNFGERKKKIDQRMSKIWQVSLPSYNRFEQKKNTHDNFSSSMQKREDLCDVTYQ